jgi:hypothetical protein
MVPRKKIRAQNWLLDIRDDEVLSESRLAELQ